MNGFQLHQTREQAELAAAHALTRADRDTRTPDEYERALWRETDRSLAKDPRRWPSPKIRLGRTPP